MIMGVFGLPGSGKSTFLTMLAKQYQKKGYRVFVNKEYPIDGCYLYTWSDIGVYDMSNSVILIDEVSMYADNRDFKNFLNTVRDFMITHRHYHCDIIWCTQQYDGVDRKIRELTSRLFYIRPSSILFGTSYATALQRVLYVPSMKDIKEHPKATITTKWAKVGFLRLLFSPINKTLRLCFRPKYYKYFDSFKTKPLRRKNFPLYRVLAGNTPPAAPAKKQPAPKPPAESSKPPAEPPKPVAESKPTLTQHN